MISNGTSPMTAPTPLTLDILRADVADMLGEAAEDVAADDNLLDLGLDSMRMLALVMKWGKTGIPLEFSALAEHTTLQEWWQVVSQLQEQARQP